MKTEFLIALPIEPMPLGAEYPKSVSLPFHCTLMHWFRPGPPLLTNRFKLVNELERFAKARSKILLRANGSANNFGPNADVKVTLFESTDTLKLLHTDLLIYVSSMYSDPEHHEWVGAGYRPHAAAVNGRVLPTNARGTDIPPYEVDSLVLVERGEDGRKFVKSEHYFG